MSLDDIERRAARAAETAASVLMMIDPAGRVSYANSAAEPLFGRSRQRLIGASLEELGGWGRVAGEIARRARESPGTSLSSWIGTSTTAMGSSSTTAK